eukprot:6475223-Amphidinium_carterae.2
MKRCQGGPAKGADQMLHETYTIFDVDSLASDCVSICQRGCHSFLSESLRPRIATCPFPEVDMLWFVSNMARTSPPGSRPHIKECFMF